MYSAEGLGADFPELAISVYADFAVGLDKVIIIQHEFFRVFQDA